jgi:hypothetical protein
MGIISLLAMLELIYFTRFPMADERARPTNPEKREIYVGVPLENSVVRFRRSDLKPFKTCLTVSLSAPNLTMHPQVISQFRFVSQWRDPTRKYSVV